MEEEERRDRRWEQKKRGLGPGALARFPLRPPVGGKGGFLRPLCASRIPISSLPPPDGRKIAPIVTVTPPMLPHSLV